MKITLAEAFKQASPGPLQIRETYWLADAKDNAIAKIAGGSERILEAPEIFANRTLLIHCFNHFQEVVEALDWLANHKSSHETKHAEASAREVLARVQKVEIP